MFPAFFLSLIPSRFGKFGFGKFGLESGRLDPFLFLVRSAETGKNLLPFPPSGLSFY